MSNLFQLNTKYETYVHIYIYIYVHDADIFN